MQEQMIELMRQSAEATLESMRQAGELNARLIDSLLAQQAGLAAFYVDAGARGLELLGRAKGYQDLTAGQAGLLREWGERHIDAFRQGAVLAQASAGAYGSLAEAGLKQAQEQLASALAIWTPQN